MRRTAPTSLLLAALAALIALPGCGTAARSGPSVGVDRAAITLARQAAAPIAAGALAEIADVPAARKRLGYVNPPALAALLPAADARAITRRVLGHRNELPAGARTAVALGSASVLHDGTTRVVHGSDRLREALDDPTPQRSVIQPVSPSAVQSCLGDAAAETLLGAETLGAGTTLGVGLRSSQDAPAGLKLVVCISPQYRSQLYGAIRRMERRFGRPVADDPRSTVIGEDEIGEQQICRAIVPVEQLAPGALEAYLGAGPALWSLLPGAPEG